MFGRRLVILVAVLMGLTALAASVAPPPDPTRRDRQGTSTPSPTPPPTPDTAVTGEVAAQLEVGAPGEPLARVRARVGNTVRLDVSGDVVDAVVVDDLPVIEPIDPDTPAQLEIVPSAPGRYPIRLLDADRQIGILDVAASG